MSEGEPLQELHDGISWYRVCDTEGLSADIVEVAAGATETLIVHHECDEAWYVLSGELVAIVGDDTSIARPGDCVAVPRGTPHGSRNEGTEPVRMLVMNAPPWSPAFDHPAG